jgi:multiple sugar transport system substrate-binding protein
MKKWAILTVVLLTLVPLAGFAGGKQEAPGGKPVTISWLNWWDSEWGKDFIDGMISDFEAQNPGIRIEKMYNPFAENYNKVLTLSQAGQLPDVFGFNAEWVAQWSEIGAVEPLDPFIKAEGKGFAEAHAAASFAKWKGETKGIYLYLSPLAVAYNINKFAEKGIAAPNAPYTWDEFTTLLKKLRNKDTKEYGLALALSEKATFAMNNTFHNWLVSAGGSLIKDGRAAFNSPQGVKALKYWADVVNNDLVVPGSMAQTDTENREYFGTGQTAMILDGMWTKGIAQQRDPNIKVGFIPTPSDATSGVVMAGSGLAMSHQSKNKVAAWKWMSYLLSEKIGAKILKKTTFPSTVVSTLDDPALQSDPMFLYAKKMMKDPATVVFPSLPDSERLLETLIKEMQMVVAGKKDAAKALDDAAAVWNTALNKK